MRLVPREIHLPKLRMRGHSVKEVISTWFPEQNIIAEKYYVEFIPHPEKNIWSTIFVVNKHGIFGEIIADGHHMLTQGFYENIKPMNFSYDFTSWQITPHDEGALIYLKSIIPSIIVEDAAKKTMLSKLLGSEFINNHLLGYFETTCTEFGTWFIDYNPVL